MAKQLLYTDEARHKILLGVEKLTRVVKCTMGPCGRWVAYEKSYGGPGVVNDGVTVAKEVELEDPFENMGAQMVRQVASKTNDVVGDGTTTATVLANAIFSEGVRFITAGHNPMAIKRGIEAAVEAVVAAIDEQAKPCSGKEDIARVATIAASDDEEIGKLIADAMAEVGKDGVVTVEEGKGTETEVPSFEHDRYHGHTNLNTFRDGFRVLRTILQDRAYARQIRTLAKRRHASNVAGPQRPGWMTDDVSRHGVRRIKRLDLDSMSTSA